MDILRVCITVCSFAAAMAHNSVFLFAALFNSMANDALTNSGASSLEFSRKTNRMSNKPTTPSSN